MAKRFKSTRDLIEGTFNGDDHEFGKKAIEHIESRRIGKLLAVMREHEGLTQSQLATKAHWGQSKVSKLESQPDDQFTMEEMRKYLSAINLTMEITFLPRKMFLAEKVKYHCGRMFTALKSIVKLSGDDRQIQDGINSFMVEAAANILKVSGFCLENINLREKRSGSDGIEIVEPDFVKSPEQRKEEAAYS